MKNHYSIILLLILVSVVVLSLFSHNIESKTTSTSTFKPTTRPTTIGSTIGSTKSTTTTNNAQVGKHDQYTKIQCPPNKSLLYHFRTTTLIGNSGIAKKGSHKGQSGRSETIISGSIILTCPSKSTRNTALNISESDHDQQSLKKNVILVTFNQVTFSQFKGRTSVNKKYRKLEVRKDLTPSLNRNSFIFTQSQSGHVENLIFKQSEERYIRSIKKGIIRMLTTETRKRARSQTDGFGGRYHKNYNRNYKVGKVTKNRRSLVIHQNFNQDDFISALPVNKRHLHYEGTHIVNVSLRNLTATTAATTRRNHRNGATTTRRGDSNDNSDNNDNGLIKEAYMKLHFTFGPSKVANSEKHYAFKEFEKLTISSKRDKLPEVDATSELETLFIGKIELKEVRGVKLSLSQDIKDTILNLEKNGRSAKLGSEFTFENSFSLNKFDRKSMLGIQRREFSPIYFKRLLNGCKQDSTLSRESNIMLAALAKYSKLHPIQAGDLLLSELKKGIQKLHNKNMINSKDERIALKNYLESIQNLVATIKSQRIQNSLVKLSSMHPYLSHNFIYASIVIPYPTEHSFGLLKSLKSKGLKLEKSTNNMNGGDKKSTDKKDDKKKNEKVIYYGDEIDNQDLMKNAYMAYADLASRIRNVKLQREIVKEIVTRIGESKSLTELTTNFHALNNAGRAVQVEILEVFLKDDRIPDTIKTLIVENMKKRLKDEDQLDEMIHSILGSTGYSPTFKSSLINAQSEREKHLKRGQSLSHLVSLHRKSKNEEIRTSIRNYLYTVGTQRAGDELAKMLKLKKKKNKKQDKAYINSLKRQHTSNTLSNLLSEEDLELLDQIHDLDQNVLFFRRMFRRIGSAIRRVARRVGGHLRRLGGRIKNLARKVGRSIGRIAKAVAKGVVKAINWIKDKILAAINAVKKIVAKIKYYFSAAKFENQKACMQVSTNQADQLCLYQPAMIEFVRKQGDLSTIKKAKHFSFEKLLGTNAVHMYMGFLVYAGASFECSAEKSGFDFVLLAKANMNAKLFKKEIVVIDASAELTKRPGEPINDNIYVKVFQTTFINTNFVPDRIRKLIEACFSETKPLVQKRFPRLVDYHFQFSIGPIPVTFNFNVALNMGVELRYGVCVEKLEASASVEPYVSLSVTGSASVGVPVAKVGVYLKATITYRIIPRLAFEKCNLCAMLQHSLEGITFDVGLTASFMSWKKEWKFFRQQTKGYVKTLFEKCIGAGGYKPSDNDSKKLEFTSQKSPTTTDSPTTETTETTQEQSNQQEGTEASPSLEEQKQKARIAAKSPEGYESNSSELKNLKSKIDSPEELQKIAQEKGVGDWAKKTTTYKPLFGPQAERIPLSGGKPPSPSKQSLRRPVTIQKVKAWTSEFLREHVPQEVIEKVGIEKLRHLPDEYFHLKIEDRAKIPNEIIIVPSEDLKHFIQHLPNRYNKKTDFKPPASAFTHVWSMEVLQKRLPKLVMEQVGLEFLRNLPEEVLQIRPVILQKIPLSVYKSGNQAIVNYICKNYKSLCKRLVKLIKSDTGKDMTPTTSTPPPTIPTPPTNNTPPVEQEEQSTRSHRGNRVINSNTNIRGGKGGRAIYMDVNINVNKRPQ